MPEAGDTESDLDTVTLYQPAAGSQPNGSQSPRIQGDGVVAQGNIGSAGETSMLGRAGNKGFPEKGDM